MGQRVKENRGVNGLKNENWNLGAEAKKRLIFHLAKAEENLKTGFQNQQTAQSEAGGGEAPSRAASPPGTGPPSPTGPASLTAACHKARDWFLCIRLHHSRQHRHIPKRFLKLKVELCSRKYFCCICYIYLYPNQTNVTCVHPCWVSKCPVAMSKEWHPPEATQPQSS